MTYGVIMFHRYIFTLFAFGIDLIFGKKTGTSASYRFVLSWRVSTSMDAAFCVEALQEASSRWGCPEIFNTDQGVQFTGEAFTNELQAAGIQISMDGRGCWMDNVFIERLWRSLKYEEVYLNAYESVRSAEQGIGKWFNLYNSRRRHQVLKKTPDEAYGVPEMKVAA